MCNGLARGMRSRRRPAMWREEGYVPRHPTRAHFVPGLFPMSKWRTIFRATAKYGSSAPSCWCSVSKSGIPPLRLYLLPNRREMRQGVNVLDCLPRSSRRHWISGSRILTYVAVRVPSWAWGAHCIIVARGKARQCRILTARTTCGTGKGSLGGVRSSRVGKRRQSRAPSKSHPKPGTSVCLTFLSYLSVVSFLRSRIREEQGYIDMPAAGAL